VIVAVTIINPVVPIATVVIEKLGPRGPEGPPFSGELPAWLNSITSLSIANEQLVVVSGGATYVINALKQ
jgi:hypothetical protein